MIKTSVHPSAPPSELTVSSRSFSLLEALGGHPVSDWDAPGRSRALGLALSGPLLLEWTKYAHKSSSFAAALGCLAALLCLCLGFARMGIALAAGVATWAVWFTFPTTPNHGVALWLGLLFVLWAELERDGVSGVVASVEAESHRHYSAVELIRWLVFAILLWAGVQKLLHSGYWNGSFFASQLALGDARFQPLQVLCSLDELKRLGAALHAGPFLPGCTWITWLSRGVVAAEITLAALLLVRRYRNTAAMLSVVFVVSIQMITGEVTFALAMCALLSVFLQRKVAMPLVVVVVASSIGLSAMVLAGQVPFLN